ncbi:hypothetical protein WA158_002464 [Blastocystis sp. Blastoise]
MIAILFFFLTASNLLRLYNSRIYNIKTVERFAFFQKASSFADSSAPFDVTLVSQTSKERIFYFNYLTKRWNGKISVGLCFDDSLADKINILTENSYFGPRVSLYQYYSNNPNVYPINLLRNIAIKNIKTTHFWLTDMDMWPACDLYESLHALPAAIHNDDKMAVIVPAFEYKMTTPCNSLEECVKVLSGSFPRNKTELLQCVDDGICNIFRMKAHTHSYIFPEWYSFNITSPYTLKTSDLPLFDPRFINYGFNKIQWIEELRYKGWAFSVLTNSFAVDVPHPKSKFAIDYIDQWKDRNKVEMKNLYDSFMKNLYTNIKDESVVYLCKNEINSKINKNIKPVSDIKMSNSGDTVQLSARQLANHNSYTNNNNNSDNNNIVGTNIDNSTTTTGTTIDNNSSTTTNTASTSEDIKNPSLRSVEQN